MSTNMRHEREVFTGLPEKPFGGSQRNTGEVFSFFGLSIIVARAQNAQLGSAKRLGAMRLFDDAFYWPFSLFGLSTQHRAMLDVGLGCATRHSFSACYSLSFYNNTPKKTQPTLVVLLVLGREELKRLFSQLYEAINAKPRSKFTLVIENNALQKVE